MDRVSPKIRSRNMAAIKSRDTKPELMLRKALYAKNVRYRLHKRIEGVRPDLVIKSKKVVIFVHGCFWHGHGCKVSHTSKSNVKFWNNKIETNRERDKRNGQKLKDLDWKIITVWECEIYKDLPKIISKTLKTI